MKISFKSVINSANEILPTKISLSEAREFRLGISSSLSQTAFYSPSNFFSCGRTILKWRSVGSAYPERLSGFQVERGSGLWEAGK